MVVAIVVWLTVLLLLLLAALLIPVWADGRHDPAAVRPPLPGGGVALRAHRAGYALGSSAQRGQVWTPPPRAPS